MWLTDCKSLEQSLNSHKVTATGGEDKRLEIDLEGLRQPLWSNPDGSPKAQLSDNPDTRVLWIDTSVMICDCLTKEGKEGFSDPLVNAYTTGILCTQPSVESEMRKLKNQKSACALLILRFYSEIFQIFHEFHFRGIQKN